MSQYVTLVRVLRLQEHEGAIRAVIKADGVIVGMPGFAMSQSHEDDEQCKGDWDPVSSCN